MRSCIWHYACARNLSSRHIKIFLSENFVKRHQIFKSKVKDSKMSVLNQSGEEQVECPLCMEPLEVDDLNFFPCTCGYQICRFCWHRIRTDENGLCPACRKAYSENPADFTPLSKEQVAQLKVEKRQRDQQRKAKLSESRKHLANVRVVQKNLVFVVGLPLRLADAEILKRHEYFGKFGKIHKVVINQSTSYAGSQGPSASAYVTYMKSDDALRAIQSVNNITIDGRLVKSSLGTTKYCSHFMKNQPCPKPDCMYLHDFDLDASFTKEQMHAGKHQEYEKKLHEVLLTKTATQNVQQQSDTKQTASCKENTGTTSNNTNKENWPQLNADKTGDKTDTSKEKLQKGKSKLKNNNNDSKKIDKNKNCESICQNQNYINQNKSHIVQEKFDKHIQIDEKTQNSVKSKDGLSDSEKSDSGSSGGGSVPKLPILDDNSSFFSQNSFQKIAPEQQTNEDDSNILSESSEHQTTHILNDSLPNITSSEDWEAAFGFSKRNNHLEELAKQRSNVKDTLETFGNGFNPITTQPDFAKLDTFNNLDSYHPQNNYESILEVLSNKNTFGQNIPFVNKAHIHEDNRLSQFGVQHHKEFINGMNGINGLSGLDQMSKFFTDIRKNGQKDVFNTMPNGFSHNINGTGMSLANGLTQNGPAQTNGYTTVADRQNFLVLQQRQIEEQLMNLNMKHQSYNNHPLLHNGLQNGQFLNGDVITQNGQNCGTVHTQQLYQNSLQISKQNNRAEDELDFDPFHETQKALAELMENEQNHKLHNTGRSGISTNQINGLVHNQSNNAHLPPPPPGFMQQQTHMNSFGSKILPFLNMNSSQSTQQINNSTQSNWPPANYTQMPTHKGISSCNDWKILDPAIVSSGRQYDLGNMQLRDQYNPAAAAQQLQNGPIRSIDYSNFSNYSQQQMPQPSYNNYSHINTPQTFNWLAGDVNSQISSPPGFRAGSQATKQQEC